MTRTGRKHLANASASRRRTHRGQLLGVGLVLGLAVAPLVFSNGFDVWTTIPTTAPFAATPGFRLVPGGAQIVTPIGFSSSGNKFRIDATSTLTETVPFSLDLTGASVTGGGVAAALNGYCCFSEYAQAPDGSTLNFTGTAPGGLLEHITITPGGVVSTTRIDPTSTNDFTGDAEATRCGLMTLTSSIDSGQTVVYTNTYTNTTGWTPIVARNSDTTSASRHPGLAVDPDTCDGYLLYPSGTNLNLEKFDKNGNSLWQLTGIVTLGAAPDATFNYFQIVEDNGNLAVLAPRDSDTIIWFTNDAGGSSPPSATETITNTGVPPGDHQAFTLDGRVATLVWPDPDGTGTETRIYLFNDNLAIPPNQMIMEDNSVEGTWHNTVPNYSVVLANASPASAQVFDANLSETFIVQGDASNVRYGSVITPLFFDGFESGDTSFWNNAVP